MPLYEFVCTTCGATFEQLVRRADQVSGVLCPACHSSGVQKQLSTFAIKGGEAHSQAAASSAACAPGGA